MTGERNLGKCHGWRWREYDRAVIDYSGVGWDRRNNQETNKRIRPCSIVKLKTSSTIPKDIHVESTKGERFLIARNRRGRVYR